MPLVSPVKVVLVAGGDGVYAYGSTSTFPTNTFKAANYWVDVVFARN